MKLFTILKNMIIKAKTYTDVAEQNAKDYTDTAEQNAKDYTDTELAPYIRYWQCSKVGVTNANLMNKTGIWSGYSLSNAPQTGWMVYLVMLHDANGSYIEQVAFPVGQPAKFWRRTLNGANNWSAWNVYNQN